MSRLATEKTAGRHRCSRSRIALCMSHPHWVVCRVVFRYSSTTRWVVFKPFAVFAEKQTFDNHPEALAYALKRATTETFPRYEVIA